MASIRRTLSPLPRQQGASLNSEVGSSPLSKSSACAQHQAPNGGVLSSFLGSVDSQAFFLGVYSPRTFRSLDRSKPKVQVWRRSLFHFFVCFSVGVFLGLSSFASMVFSSYSLSKHQVFSFGTVSIKGKFQEHEIMTGDESSAWSTVKNATILEPPSKRNESSDLISDSTIINQSLLQDSARVYKQLLIIITPTYARPFQAYYLTRLANTLKLVEPPLLWIVVEMSSQSVQTADLLRRTGVVYRHLVCRDNLTNVKDRSIHQRNAALAHIETHHLDGIVHFADDYNVYSADLFEHMRGIRRFGTWTVAKVSEDGRRTIVEGPVCNGTRVIGWHTKEPFRRFRRFHAEMSGFAFNSTILWDRTRWHRPTVEPIRQSDTVEDPMKVSAFIEQLVEEESQMEGLPENCSSISLWHLHLESASPSYPAKWLLTNSLDALAQLP